jgi:hypothetical protein
MNPIALTGLTSPNRDNEDQSSNLQQKKYTGILNSDEDSSTSLKEFELTNSKLGAFLTQNNPKTTHKLILDFYANSGETIDAPPTSPYPERPSIILQTGSLISIVSANPDITFKSTELTLYDKSDLPFYPTSNDTNSWSLDVPPGLYKLKVKTEYSHDNGHTVSFIDTIRITKGKDLNVKEYINKKLSHIEGLRDTN